MPTCSHQLAAANAPPAAAAAAPPHTIRYNSATQDREDVADEAQKTPHPWFRCSRETARSVEGEKCHAHAAVSCRPDAGEGDAVQQAVVESVPVISVFFSTRFGHFSLFLLL